LTLPDGVAFAAPTAYPVNFNFCPSGVASAKQSFSISGVTPAIAVEAATGYVY